MRQHRYRTKEVHAATRYDIRLALDVRCQKLIEKILLTAFPNIPILGEEGVVGDLNAEQRWVVDPIDGTVNFARGIPHACVSIALQARRAEREERNSPHGVTTHHASRFTHHETIAGVVYDPFCNELWTAIRGQPARLNGRIIKVSDRRRLEEAIVVMGFAKSKATLDTMLPVFNQLARRTHKVRSMGSAALALVYVASGRFDAYIEANIRLWDIAAGGLILECAGGEFWHRAVRGEHAFQLIATNGLLRPKLRVDF